MSAKIYVGTVFVSLDFDL